MKLRFMFVSVISLVLVTMSARAATVQAGLGYLAEAFKTGNPTNVSLANAEFQAVVSANPTNYPARVYAGFAKLFNLMNDTQLNTLMSQFGFDYADMGGTNGWDVTGEFDPGAPLPNSAVDTIWSRSQPAIDAAYSLLDAIPSSWAGTAEIATNYFPVDTAVYVDYADVVSAKAMLQSLRSFLNTVRAYDLKLDYAKLVWPVTLPVAPITVDGNPVDWSGIPVQLVGEEGNALKKVKACRSGSTLFLLVEKANFADEQEYWYQANGALSVKINGQPAELDFNYYRNGGYVYSELKLRGELIGDTSTNMLLSVQVSGNYLEMSFTLPGLTEGGRVDWLWMGGWSSWVGSELGFPDNYPASSLLALAPDFLKSVGSPTALTEAKTNLIQALTLAQAAGPLIKNRTDVLLHFLQYDPADAAAYDELTNNIAKSKASLSSPQWFVVDGGLNDINVYLGAFYTVPYVTRSMLPAYATEALLANPTPGTFPDPTFGGILPDFTQSKITAMLNGYPLNVVAPGGVTASQEESSSKISLSWYPVEGADTYEVWRSTQPNVGSAIKVATVSGGSYTDSNLEPGSTYYYWVRGVNSYQVGAFNVSPIIGITRARAAMPWLNLLLE